MKRSIATLLVATLFLTAGCSKDDAPVSVQNASEAMADNIEAQASLLENRAGAAVNVDDDQELANAASVFEAMTGGANGSSINAR